MAWEDFSITVAEKDAGRVPEILDQLEARAVEMGARARQQWEEHFSEQARFHYVIEQCLDIQRSGNNGVAARRLRLLRQAGNPRNFRHYLSSKMNLYRQTGKIYW